MTRPRELSGAQPWQDAFLGVSAVLGEPVVESLGALDDGASSRLELVPSLQSSSRDVRARAIARSIAAVLASLDELRLR